MNRNGTVTDLDLREQARAAAELLESLDADRALLDQLPPEHRERLHRAVAQFYHPDPVARRRRIKAAERERNAAAAERDGAVLHETGIRVLRRQPIFTTPNFYPPEDFEQQDRPEAIEPRHCYVCKQKFSA